MNLQLAHTKVVKLNLNQTEISSHEDGNDVSFKFVNAYSEDSVKTFQVIFEMTLDISDISDSTSRAQLDIEYVALFEASDEIDEEFKESAFPRVNAPAIAYPFLRAFIGNFLLNGGYEPIMLPSINFQALYNK